MCWVFLRFRFFGVSSGWRGSHLEKGWAGCYVSRADSAPRPTCYPTIRLLPPLHSAIFTPLHPPNTLSEHLPPTAHLGPVDPTTLPDPADTPEDPDEARVRQARENMPPIESILNLQDMEDLAEKVLSRTGWAYYRSASDLEDCEWARMARKGWGGTDLGAFLDD